MRFQGIKIIVPGQKGLHGKITVTLIQRLEDLDLGTWTWMLGFGDLDGLGDSSS